MDRKDALHQSITPVTNAPRNRTMVKSIRVAVVQFDPVLGKVDENIARVDRMLDGYEEDGGRVMNMMSSCPSPNPIDCIIHRLLIIAYYCPSPIECFIHRLFVDSFTGPALRDHDE